MANLSPAILILILIVGVIVALVVGYFLGSRFGGKKSVAVREATEKHNSYRNDVREHFERTSAIMSRMVDDYRDMYKHMAEGADKLAEMHPEKRVTPPPAPEAITRDTAVDGSRKTAPSAASPTPEASKSNKPAQARNETGTGAGKASDQPKDAEPQTAATPRQEKPEARPSGQKPAAASSTTTAAKPESEAKKSDAVKPATNTEAAPGGSDKSNAPEKQTSADKKTGKRYGLE